MLYCDLDGVLADFDKRCMEVFGQYPNSLNERYMWATITKHHPHFYADLDWMPDGKELWNVVKEYVPTILTGTPRSVKAARNDKLKWCAIELGEDVPVIAGPTRDKPLYASPGAILIDDRVRTKAGWENAGGIFILHTSAKQSIEELKLHGYD